MDLLSLAIWEAAYMMFRRMTRWTTTTCKLVNMSSSGVVSFSLCYTFRGEAVLCLPVDLLPASWQDTCTKHNLACFYGCISKCLHNHIRFCCLPAIQQRHMIRGFISEYFGLCVFSLLQPGTCFATYNTKHLHQLILHTPAAS